MKKKSQNFTEWKSKNRLSIDHLVNESKIHVFFTHCETQTFVLSCGRVFSDLLKTFYLDFFYSLNCKIFVKSHQKIPSHLKQINFFGRKKWALSIFHQIGFYNCLGKPQKNDDQALQNWRHYTKIMWKCFITEKRYLIWHVKWQFQSYLTVWWKKVD